MPLPNDRDARNALPVWDGCIAYFPDCWAEIAKVSVIGNKQHALGTKLRFARDVSTDHANKVMRHMLDHQAGRIMDNDGTYHLAKAAWRALAALQVAIEAQAGVSSNVEAVIQGLDDGKANGQNAQCDPNEPVRWTGPELSY
jgi:hypothetical protein